MALNDNALTTVDNVKDELGTTTVTDAYIERQINVVSQKVERYCKRQFGKQSHTERYEGTDSLRLLLDNYPILSVTSMTIDDQTVDVNDLTISRAATNLYYGETVITNLFQPFGFPKQTLVDGLSEWQTKEVIPDILVTYVAGYVLPKDDGAPDARTLPYDLEEAVISEVVNKVLNKGTGGRIIESEKLFSGSIKYKNSTVSDNPANSEKFLESTFTTIDSYRRRCLT